MRASLARYTNPSFLVHALIPSLWYTPEGDVRFTLAHPCSATRERERSQGAGGGEKHGVVYTDLSFHTVSVILVCCYWRVSPFVTFGFHAVDVSNELKPQLLMTHTR